MNERIHKILSAPSDGPWEAKEYGYEKHAIIDPRGTDIAFAHRANDARLIAAAPELYSALAEATELLEMSGYSTLEMRTALAKARG